MSAPARPERASWSSPPSLSTQALHWALPLFVVLGMMWFFEIVDVFLLSEELDGLGIRPRDRTGIAGVLLHPLLHVGFGHLAANTTAIAMFGALTLWARPRDFWLVLASATVVGGVGTWLVGQAGSVHIGASGVAFGLLGYVLARGLFERAWWSLGVSGTVGFLFGGTLLGMVPGIAPPGISWECHLFGFVGGVVIANLYRSRGEQPRTLEDFRTGGRAR